jgi:hypothetical protein
VAISIDADAMRQAAEHGRICAVAGRGQRALKETAARYPALCPDPPFDATLFSTVAMAMAFSAPWCDADQLRVANRAVLWGFAADWQIDYLARRQGDVDALVARCLAVADGGQPAPHDALARMLAEIRDELTTVPGFERVHGIWRGELARMLGGMALEWAWKNGNILPTFEDYLDNADNLGASWVNVGHWVNTGDAVTHRRLAELTEAGREEQRVLRLINDLATYERDVKWGDLNALMLVPDREDLDRRIAVLVDGCLARLRPLAGDCPREVDYLERQIGFTGAFYRTSDFWGSL